MSIARLQQIRTCLTDTVVKKMKDIRALLTLFFSVSLFSCTSDDADSQVELFLSDTIRQTLQFDETNLIVQISVNGGVDQTFEIDTSQSTNVMVTGILPEEQNSIRIVWIEVVDGRNVEISQQTQDFIANGNTIIDAQHDYSLYDYDNDSITNFDERLADTCVWSLSDQCEAGDLPTNPLENLLVNGNFSNLNANWFVSGENANFLEGEYCLTSLSSATNAFQSQIGYSEGIQLEGGRNYVYAFDIKADQPASAVAVVNGVPNTNIVNQHVSVSTSYERKMIQFPTFRSWPDARLLINIGDSPSVRFCFDNISLSFEE